MVDKPFPERLLALDLLRGAAACLLILVLCPGTSSAHPEWLVFTKSGRGFGPADLLYPLFFFIMGVSMWFSFEKHKFRFSKPLLINILRRSLIFFALGLVAHNVFFGRTTTFGMRFHPLLHLGFGYAISAFLVLICSRRVLMLTSLALIIVYGVLFVCLPQFAKPTFPSAEAGLDDMASNTMLPVDIYGLTATIACTFLCLLGWLSAVLLAHLREKKAILVRDLGLWGLALVFIGLIWDLVLPISPPQWTGSYLLLSAGISILLFGLCLWLIDLRQWRNGTGFFFAFGQNTLLAASLSQVLYLVSFTMSAQTETGISHWIAERCFAPWAGAGLGSLLFSLCILLLCWLLCRYLLTHNKRYTA
jgi:predicted acyltransferase